MMRIITRTRQRGTQPGLTVEHIGSSAGVPGTIMSGPAGVVSPLEQSGLLVRRPRVSMPLLAGPLKEVSFGTAEF